VRGFEEGIVEGLTRQIVIDDLGLRPVLTGYHQYVAVYRALAEASAIDVTGLWERSWTIPPGAVSHEFLSVLDESLAAQGRSSLGTLAARRVWALARLQFATSRGSDQPDLEALVAAWRQVIR
jgi:hypothetical protein